MLLLTALPLLASTSACSDDGGDPMAEGSEESGSESDTDSSATETASGDGDGDTASDSDSDSEGEDWQDLPDPELPAELLDYGHELPDHFLTPFVASLDNTPPNNPVTDAGATLGRVLFWDKRLSQNGTVACGSCHAPDIGFTDDLALSLGFEGEQTGRNSMPLINVRWYGRASMFWDERADTLEDQVLMPLQDPAEMGMTLEEVVFRVESTDYYGPLFEAAFGDAGVSEERISLAMAQFVRSIVSYRAPWDAGVQAVDGDIGQDFPNYSAQQNRGKDVFFGQTGNGPNAPGAPCAACHGFANPLTPLPPNAPPGAGTNTAIFHIPVPSNNGLIDDADGGVGDVTGNPQDDGRFKSPSLRNVGQTGPFMHDGRFETLAEVVEHYNEGIEDHPNLDPILSVPGPGGGPIQLNLSPEDQQALVAFLDTLTDETLATDPRWGDPFPE